MSSQSCEKGHGKCTKLTMQYDQSDIDGESVCSTMITEYSY